MGYKNMTRTLAGLSAIGILAVGCADNEGDGGDFPTDTIEIIVPFSAGGAADTNARAFAEAWQQVNDSEMVVINRPGGGTAIGANEVLSSEADGHTLFFSSGSTHISLPLMEDVDWETDDWRSIVSFGDLPITVLASADSGWETLDDVPMDSELQVPTTAPGNVLHLIVSNFVEEAGGTSNYIPFDASNETIQQVIDGNADIVAADAGLALPRIESGELVPLAVATSERLDFLPEVPTMEEAGYENSHDRYSRHALSVPADTPKEAVDVIKAGWDEASETEVWDDFLTATYMQEPGYEAEAYIEEFVPNELEWTRESFEAAGVDPNDSE